MPTTIATTADAPLSVTIAAGAYAAAITAKSIESNWHALSHAPERRARMELNALAERLNAFGAHVAALADAGGNVDAAREGEGRSGHDRSETAASFQTLNVQLPTSNASPRPFSERRASGVGR